MQSCYQKEERLILLKEQQLFYEVFKSDQETCLFLLSLIFKTNTQAVKIGAPITVLSTKI